MAARAREVGKTNFFIFSRCCGFCRRLAKWLVGTLGGVRQAFAVRRRESGENEGIGGWAGDCR